MAEWGFYGRRQERAQLAQVLSRGRWFFLQISGRRRIGKTRLVQELLQPERRERVLYIQIPDSDPAGVVSTARDFMENFGVSAPLPHDLRSLAVRIGELCAEGWIVALDEFQYFNRKALYPFTSELQSVVDRLAATPEVRGGLIVLGSLHTEMQALLEDRSAPSISASPTPSAWAISTLPPCWNCWRPMRTPRRSGCCSSGTCSRGCPSFTATASSRG
jgi:hypothetical protein